MGTRKAEAERRLLVRKVHDKVKRTHNDRTAAAAVEADHREAMVKMNQCDGSWQRWVSEDQSRGGVW